VFDADPSSVSLHGTSFSEGCPDTAGSLIEEYRWHCSNAGIPLELNTSVRPQEAIAPQPPNDLDTSDIPAEPFCHVAQF
jgi:hypothetical protein